VEYNPIVRASLGSPQVNVWQDRIFQQAVASIEKRNPTLQDQDQNVTLDEPLVETVRRLRKRRDRRTQQQPRYHVVLWNDEDHSYEYVIRMLRKLFGHPVEKGFAIAKQVDTHGRAICLTTTKEHAELKRDQIHAYGKDSAVKGCQGSMSASIEPEQ